VHAEGTWKILTISTGVQDGTNRHGRLVPSSEPTLQYCFFCVVFLTLFPQNVSCIIPYRTQEACITTHHFRVYYSLMFSPWTIK
jgi:hypothetical protein